MTDFISAFKKGLELAELAQKHRNEINDVFTELNSQLEKETKGQLKIKISKYYKPQSSMAAIAGNLIPRLSYFAISATNPTLSEKEIVELAEWDQDSRGYPCMITFDENELFCEDKESLEENLARMLSNPLIADKLYNLMNIPSPEK